MLLCMPVVCFDVHPSLVLNYMQELGVEETSNGIDKPSEERNLTKYQEGLSNLPCTLERTLEGKVWPEGLCSNERNTSLCWVCRYCGF